MKIAIADNASYHLLPSLDYNLIISQFQYDEALTEEGNTFLSKYNPLLIGINERQFISNHSYDIGHASIIASLSKCRCYHEFMIDGLKYIVVNGSIPTSTKKPHLLKPSMETGWQNAYDGRFGYAITMHVCTNENSDIIYFDYGASLPYVEGKITLASVEKNGISANILP